MKFLKLRHTKLVSIVSILKYIESNSSVSADTIELLKKEIYSALQNFSDSRSVHINRNAKRKAKKLLSNIDTAFASSDVRRLVAGLKLQGERSEFHTTGSTLRRLFRPQGQKVIVRPSPHKL